MVEVRGLHTAVSKKSASALRSLLGAQGFNRVDTRGSSGGHCGSDHGGDENDPR